MSEKEIWISIPNRWIGKLEDIPRESKHWEQKPVRYIRGDDYDALAKELKKEKELKELYQQKHFALDKERDQALELLKEAKEVINKLCPPMSDGFGGTIADEFMEPEVLEARAFLERLEGKNGT